MSRSKAARSYVPSREVNSDPELLKVWKETFRNAYAKANQERGFLSKAFQMALQWWLQMILPTDEQVGTDYSINFQMKRSPRGHLAFCCTYRNG